jgi:hypothetical protein
MNSQSWDRVEGYLLKPTSSNPKSLVIKILISKSSVVVFVVQMCTPSMEAGVKPQCPYVSVMKL